MDAPAAAKRLIGLAMLAAIAVLAPATASADGRSPRPSFSLPPEASLQPRVRWSTTDYVVRCQGQPLRVRVRGASGWKTRVGTGPYRSGSFSATVGAAPGNRFVIASRRRARHGGSVSGAHRYSVRCLPLDFPDYEYRRQRRGGPEFFTAQLTNRYAAIFNADGIPAWWHQASGHPNNVELLRDGTIAWAPVPTPASQVGKYEVHDLNGRLLRTVSAEGGATPDIHELLLRSNGNLVLGTQTIEEVDASPFGKPADATATGIEIQEITPRGRVVWRWDSADHIKPGETGRWWDLIPDFQPYDYVHWNAVDYDGNYAYLSFRHLDAVYKVNRRTGNIVWKLGGTHTSKSLEVRGDPEGDYPFGGQHDVRVQPDGTITVFDNNSRLDPAPRATQWEIDEKAGTATLVQAVRDPHVELSICCGSARLLKSQDWLIAWGGAADGVVGSYDRRGRRIFELRTPGAFGYRALPIDDRLVSARELRRAMDRQHPEQPGGAALERNH